MNTRNFKDSTKAAATYLAEQGIDVPHTRLLEALARAFGERNWSTLSAQLQELKAPAASAPVSPALDGVEAVPAWDSLLEPMSDAQFVADGGNCCPFCGSRNVETDSIQADGSRAWDETECGDCHAAWTSNYDLTGYTCTREGKALGEPEALPAAIILVWPGTFTVNMEGFLFSLASVRSTLLEHLEASQDSTDDELLELIQDEPGCIMALRDVGVAHRSRAVRAQEWEIRTQLAMEAREMGFELKVGRSDVIDDLVEDVKERARKYGFSAQGWQRAVECVAESNEVLNLDATPAEKFAAASHLA